jgi:2-polyprenyl-3-methyl-5-hydroxy-6-metoxy-1,4-benzoquinol methylase
MECIICNSSLASYKEPIQDHSISKERFELVTCGICGMVYTGGVPKEEDCGRYYKSEDYVSHSDTNKGLFFSIYHRVRSYMLNRKVALVRSYHSEGKVLDMGCGTGYFVHALNEAGYKTIGIEVDDDARNVGVKKFGIQAHGNDYLLENKLDGPFQIITLWHVLEHLYSPERYMAKFKQNLAKDGVLIIAVPNCSSYDAKHYGSLWAGYDVPRHLWHFEPRTMELWARKNGFTIIDKKTMPFDSFYVSILSEKYKNSGLGLIRGGMVGLISWVKALINKNRASSVIYVMKQV